MIAKYDRRIDKYVQWLNMSSVFIKENELIKKLVWNVYTYPCYGMVFDFALCFVSSCFICTDIGINSIIPEEHTYEKYESNI